MASFVAAIGLHPQLSNRHRTIAGTARDPGAAWVRQMFRNLLDACDGFLLRKSHIP